MRSDQDYLRAVTTPKEQVRIVLQYQVVNVSYRSEPCGLFRTCLLSPIERHTESYQPVCVTTGTSLTGKWANVRTPSPSTGSCSFGEFNRSEKSWPEKRNTPCIYRGMDAVKSGFEKIVYHSVGGNVRTVRFSCELPKRSLWFRPAYQVYNPRWTTAVVDDGAKKYWGKKKVVGYWHHLLLRAKLQY